MLGLCMTATRARYGDRFWWSSKQSSSWEIRNVCTVTQSWDAVTDWGFFQVFRSDVLVRLTAPNLNKKQPSHHLTLILLQNGYTYGPSAFRGHAQSVMVWHLRSKSLVENGIFTIYYLHYGLVIRTFVVCPWDWVRISLWSIYYEGESLMSPTRLGGLGDPSDWNI